MKISYLTCGGINLRLSRSEFLASCVQCFALLKTLEPYYNLCHQGRVETDRSSLLILSVSRRGGNEKHALPLLCEASYFPSLFDFATSSISFPTSSPNSALDMGLEKLHSALNFELRSGLYSSRCLRFSSISGQNHYQSMNKISLKWSTCSSGGF